MVLPKILLRRTLLTIVLVGLVFYLALFLDFILLDDKALITENVIVLPTQRQINLLASLMDVPVRLKIPKINVDSAVEYVGLASDGTMDVPKERANVAWFNLGSRPGENGSAVIAGHYGLKNGRGSAFDNLHKLRKGDKLYIEDDSGVIISFVVRESRRYDPQADASSVFSSSDGMSHLNLITCEGEWDEDTQQYPKRLVVFTDKLEQ